MVWKGEGRRGKGRRGNLGGGGVRRVNVLSCNLTAFCNHAVTLRLRLIAKPTSFYLFLGLLGTNNNEFHDEFMTVKNKPTKKLTEFVNSWEITRDPECKIHSIVPEKPKCKETSYIQRCRALFKDKKSPLHRYFSVVNPEPFVKACEIDYKDCETSTPKDMKHCNTTAAYIELVRMRGEWADFLPECGKLKWSYN